MSTKNNHQDENQYGVLLYYKYATIPDLNSLFDFYDSNCKSLGLLGRVRLASHGVNVTVGGELSALECHIEAVKAMGLFEGTDFKLASSHQPLDDKVAQECGFTSLSIRIVQELVTLSSHPLLNPPDISNAGKHLSAVEFHSFIQSAGKLLDEDCPAEDKKLVLVDARNLYETRIGKFHSPHVETLDPNIRQYSDLPSWIDDNAEQLRGKNILMYCTGGIRCEMASAYVKSKGSGFENVFQLYGGIQRYLEQFPDGGFFKGKNFVFDHRISVGSSDKNILGNCLLCGSSFDDYSSRCRCNYCRMLVLVCDSCRTEGAIYTCELCQNHGKGLGSLPSNGNGKTELFKPRTVSSDASISPQPTWRHGSDEYPRKLRILCLHGFRQNASGFKGRTGSLAKKLKNIAELVFIDAPHELAFIYRPSNESSPTSPPPPPENCRKKYAWLVAPNSNESTETDWKKADGPFDPLQYQHQTEGFNLSLSHLKKVFSQEGPFDGILGFSQGAAMSASVCALRERLKDEMDFSFGIICSGYPLPSTEFQPGSINCPSLHIFGSQSGNDRQISTQASRDLAMAFDDGCSTVIEHDSGHIIPTRPPYIDQIKSFLQQFI